MNLLFYNVTNPTDPDVFKWGNTRLGHSEFMVPIKDKDGTDCITEEGAVACHTKRVASELSKISERALDKEVSMFREGQRSFGRSEDPPSEPPLMRQFKKMKFTFEPLV